MDAERQARQERAIQRRNLLVGRLVSPLEDEAPVGSTVIERLEILAEISRRAWELSGQPVPTWTRMTMPGRVLRPSTQS